MTHPISPSEAKALEVSPEAIGSLLQGFGLSSVQVRMTMMMMLVMMVMMMMMMINDSRQKHLASHTSERTFVPRTAIFDTVDVHTPKKINFVGLLGRRKYQQ